MSEIIERIASAVREEIVRQYRDDGRGKCPVGAYFYEEGIGPVEIALAAIEAMREPTIGMLDAAHEANPIVIFDPDKRLERGEGTPLIVSVDWAEAWRSMIDALLGRGQQPQPVLKASD